VERLNIVDAVVWRGKGNRVNDADRRKGSKQDLARRQEGIHKEERKTTELEGFLWARCGNFGEIAGGPASPKSDAGYVYLTVSIQNGLQLPPFAFR
jgi:hypothetical protein